MLSVSIPHMVVLFWFLIALCLFGLLLTLNRTDGFVRKFQQKVHFFSVFFLFTVAVDSMADNLR